MIDWNDVIRFASGENPKPPTRVEMTDQKWKELLTTDSYFVTRQKGTERAHSSEMCSLFEPGRYKCICCGTALFDASEKFASKSGWPSFTQPVAIENIAHKRDKGYGMERIEVLCNVCDAHLGHVFPDGPAPSGLRYCINAVALEQINE